MFALEGGAPVLGRTSDVSADGVSINVAQPVAVGQGAQLRFDLLVDGKVVHEATAAALGIEPKPAAAAPAPAAASVQPEATPPERGSA